MRSRARRQAVRPVLCLATGEAFGARVEDLLPAAAAVELVHSFSLVHDDLPALDDDRERRGAPSRLGAYGEAIAILAGDALLAEAFRLALTYPSPAVARELSGATLGDDRRPAARPRGRAGRLDQLHCAEDRRPLLGLGDVRALGGGGAGARARAVARIRERARPALPGRRRRARRRRLCARGRRGARSPCSQTRRRSGHRRGSPRSTPTRACSARSWVSWRSARRERPDRRARRA